MSKQFFAEWLPVEGDSDYVQCWGKAVCKRSKSNSAIYHLIDNAEGAPPITDFEVKTIPQGFKHVKLFLCSRDIQVGDECHYRGFKGKVGRSIHGKQVWVLDDSEGNHLIYADDLDSLFKVVGEISQEATWVKEGDEFDREDLRANGVGVNWSEESHDSGKYKFKIKCPTCNHFH
jgi:hypothetical protein